MTSLSSTPGFLSTSILFLISKAGHGRRCRLPTEQTLSVGSFCVFFVPHFPSQKAPQALIYPGGHFFIVMHPWDRTPAGWLLCTPRVLSQWKECAAKNDKLIWKLKIWKSRRSSVKHYPLKENASVNVFSKGLCKSCSWGFSKNYLILMMGRKELTIQMYWSFSRCLDDTICNCSVEKDPSPFPHTPVSLSVSHTHKHSGASRGGEQAWPGRTARNTCKRLVLLMPGNKSSHPSRASPSQPSMDLIGWGASTHNTHPHTHTHAHTDINQISNAKLLIYRWLFHISLFTLSTPIHDANWKIF